MNSFYFRIISENDIMIRFFKEKGQLRFLIRDKVLHTKILSEISLNIHEYEVKFH